MVKNYLTAKKRKKPKALCYTRSFLTASACFSLLFRLSGIVLFSAKVKPDRPLVNGKTGEELIWEWLTKYEIDNYIKEITCEKPRAVCYIDDRGIRFESWEQTLKQFNEITNK